MNSVIVFVTAYCMHIYLMFNGVILSVWMVYRGFQHKSCWSGQKCFPQLLSHLETLKNIAPNAHCIKLSFVIIKKKCNLFSCCCLNPATAVGLLFTYSDVLHVLFTYLQQMWQKFNNKIKNIELNVFFFVSTCIDKATISQMARKGLYS